MPAGVAGTSAGSPSAAPEHPTRRDVKLQMKQWELEFEYRNGGLVPTQEDKRADAHYTELKALAKKLTSQAKHSRPADRGRASAPAADAPANTDGAGSSGSGGGGGGGGGSTSGGAPPAAPTRTKTAHLYTVHAPTAVAMPEESQYNFDSGRISISPCSVLMLMLLVATPYAAFCAAFSLIGFGAMIKDYLTTNAWLYVPIAYFSISLLLLLYLFDVSYWEDAAAVVARRVLLSVAGFAIVLGGFLSTKEYPYAPLLMFFFLTPLYWWLLQRRLRSWPTPDFLSALSITLFLLSALAASIWFVWFSMGNTWSVTNKRRYMLQMRCCTTPTELADLLYEGGYTTGPVAAASAFSMLNLMEPEPTTSMWGGIRWPSFSSVSLVGSPILSNASSLVATLSPRVLNGAATDEAGCLVLPEDPCMAVLLFWVSPFVSAMAGFVAAIVAFLLGRYLRAENLAASGVSAGARIFLVGIVLSAVALWVASSLAGASMGMSRVVLLGTAVVVILLASMLNYLFGWKLLLTAIMAKEPLARRIIRFCVTSDWTKAAAIAIGLPILLLGIALSVANQLIRVHVLRRVVLPEKAGLYTTELVDGWLQKAAGWNWVSVLRKTIVLCLAYLVMVVGVAKAVTLFMSWLMKALKPLPLTVSTAIFFGVGFSMFLLPPVPGAPVYMASGVLLTSACEEQFGYWGAAVYAMAVAFCIKLFACACQQKLIGGLLKSSVAVREACGVNSSLMRAIKLMMGKKRMSRGKVAVLVGGPDWPTSVLMGIMGLPLLPILAGTLPVICLVAPLSLTGSFMIKGPVSPFPALNNLALAASTLSQIGPLLLAMHYIERSSFDEKEALADMPIDEEVRKLELAGEEYFALYSELTHWKSPLVPTTMKALLVIGAIGTSLACQVATFRPSSCFLDFGLYPDYDTQVRENLGGAWINIVLPTGWCVLGLGVFGYLCRLTFVLWASRLVRHEFGQGRRAARTNSRTLSRAATSSAVAAYAAGVPMGRGNFVREWDEAGDASHVFRRAGQQPQQQQEGKARASSACRASVSKDKPGRATGATSGAARGARLPEALLDA